MCKDAALLTGGGLEILFELDEKGKSERASSRIERKGGTPSTPDDHTKGAA